MKCQVSKSRAQGVWGVVKIGGSRVLGGSQFPQIPLYHGKEAGIYIKAVGDY